MSAPSETAFDASAVGARARALREHLGLTLDEVARAAGYSNRTGVSKVESGHLKSLPRERAEALASALGTTVEYLLCGETATGEAATTAGTAIEEGAADLVYVPRPGVSPSMGGGLVPLVGGRADLVPMTRELFRERFRREAPSRGALVRGVALFRVTGDSMSPEIEDGEELACETYDPPLSAPPGDGLYVVRLGDVVMCKRAQIVGVGLVELRSSNPFYRPTVVSLRAGETADGDDFAVLARVIARDRFTTYALGRVLTGTLVPTSAVAKGG